MRILIATDAWHPQVNGVVRTLTSLARSAAALDADIDIPDAGRVSVDGRCRPIRACGSRCRTGARSQNGSRRRRPTRSISRPKVRSAGRCAAYCRRHKLAFTTSYTTRFPEYVEVRTGHSGQCRLCGAAALSRRRRHDHGRDRLAAAGAQPARFQQARLLDPRRRYRSVHARRTRPRSICRGRSS